MSLPIKAVDRIFLRLLATYGTEFSGRYAGVQDGDLKSMWAHELAGFASDLASIAWALENLPERCPNVIEFRNLCRQAPRAAEPQLPAPQADPERLRAELAKLADVRNAAVEPVGAKDWARRILARVDAGERINRTVHRFAREALGLPVRA